MRFRKKSGDRAEKQGAAAAKDTEVAKDAGFARNTDAAKDAGTSGDADAAEGAGTDAVTDADASADTDAGKDGDTVESTASRASTSSAESSGSAEAAPDQSSPDDAAADETESVRTAGGPPKKTSNRRLVAVAVAGAIVFAVFAGVAGWRWAVVSGESPAETNSAFVDQSKTVEVADAARSIAEGVFTYDYTKLDEYQSSLQEHLDEQMLERYQETADQNVEIITQAKTTIQATVADGDVGVQKIHGDKATALLIMSRSGNNNGEQQVSDAAPLRLTMVEEDGQWKADSIELL